MGALCNQPARPTRDINGQDIHNFIDMIKEVSEKKKISLEYALKVYELMAYERRTNVMIDNGNFTDENMCGIGTAIKDIAVELHDVAAAIEEFHRE